MKYSDKLKDPRWQKKRLEILQRDGWRCLFCGDKDNTLHVHHLAYIKGVDPWDYVDGVLVTVCEECHDREHSDRAYIDSVLPALFRCFHVGSAALLNFMEAFQDYSEKCNVSGNAVFEELISELRSKTRGKKAA